jgi:hypothetical protein
MRTSLLTLALVAVACSSSPSTDGGTHPDAGGGPTGDAACTASGTARCDQEQKCEPATFDNAFADMPTCISREKASCLNALAAKGTGNTPTTVQACADAYATWSCPDWFNTVTPTACKIQVGTGASGSSCSFSAQCASAFCDITTGTSCGICAPPPTVGTNCGGGGGCGGNSLFCDTNTHTCQTLVTTQGAFCDAGSCGYLLGCVVPTDGGVSSCQALGQSVDAGCDGQQHTAPACSSGFGFACERKYCSVELFANAGEFCGTDRDAGTFTRCGAGSTCAGVTGAETCVAGAADTMACDTANGVDCLSPSRCVSATGGSNDAGDVVGTCQASGSATCQ